MGKPSCRIDNGEETRFLRRAISISDFIGSALQKVFPEPEAERFTRFHFALLTYRIMDWRLLSASSPPAHDWLHQELCSFTPS